MKRTTAEKPANEEHAFVTTYPRKGGKDMGKKDELLTGAIRRDALTRLTREERKATTQLLLGGGTDAICEQAYQEAAVHMPQVVAELRALNPDAQIILLGYTNPVPLLPEWTQLFRRLNALSKSLAAQNENVTYVPIPFAMTATDAHPTVSGHKYIANRILRAIKK